MVYRGWGCSIPFGYLPQRWPVGPGARSQGTTDSGPGPTFSSDSRALSWFVGPLRTSAFPLKDVYLLLCSIWGAAAFPAAVGLGIRRHNRSKARSRLQSD